MKTQLVMIYIFTASVAVMAWGGTTTQDPMAEKYSDLSPYLWCATPTPPDASSNTT